MSSKERLFCTPFGQNIFLLKLYENREILAITTIFGFIQNSFFFIEKMAVENYWSAENQICLRAPSDSAQRELTYFVRSLVSVGYFFVQRSLHKNLHKTCIQDHRYQHHHYKLLNKIPSSLRININRFNLRPEHVLLGNNDS